MWKCSERSSCQLGLSRHSCRSTSKEDRYLQLQLPKPLVHEEKHTRPPILKHNLRRLLMCPQRIKHSFPIPSNPVREEDTEAKSEQRPDAGMGADFRDSGLEPGAVFGEEVMLVVVFGKLAHVASGGVGAEGGERVLVGRGHCGCCGGMRCSEIEGRGIGEVDREGVD